MSSQSKKGKRLSSRTMLIRPGYVTVPVAIVELGKALYSEKWLASPVASLLPFYAQRTGPRKSLVLKQRVLFLKDGQYKLTSQVVSHKGISKSEIEVFNLQYRNLKSILMDAISSGGAVLGRKPKVSKQAGDGSSDTPNVFLALPYHAALEIGPNNANILRSQAHTVATVGYAAAVVDQTKYYGVVTISEKWLDARISDLRRPRAPDELDRQKFAEFANELIDDIKATFKEESNWPTIQVDDDLMIEERIIAIFGKFRLFKRAPLKRMMEKHLPKALLTRSGRPNSTRRDKTAGYLKSFFEKRRNNGEDTDDQ